MNWNRWIRQIHRWVSIAFTLAVIANFAAMAIAPEAIWVAFLALPPLFVLLGTGLFLFVLPHLPKRYSRRSSME
jgi:hypothetical protein